MPVARQRQYVEEYLDLRTILMARAVDDAESAEAPWTEGEARERIEHWLAVFWPVDDDHVGQV